MANMANTGSYQVNGLRHGPFNARGSTQLPRRENGAYNTTANQAHPPQNNFGMTALTQSLPSGTPHGNYTQGSLYPSASVPNVNPAQWNWVSPDGSTAQAVNGLPNGAVVYTTIAYPYGGQAPQNAGPSAPLRNYPSNVPHRFGVSQLGGLGSYTQQGWGSPVYGLGPHGNVSAGSLPGLEDHRSMGSFREGEVSMPATPNLGVTGLVHPSVVVPGTPQASPQGHTYGMPANGFCDPGFQPMLPPAPAGPHTFVPESYPNSTMIGALPFARRNTVHLRKPLEKALENPYGITNIYVSGLQPETTDYLFMTYASKFGQVLSSKAILDEDGSCRKGIGFAWYQKLDDAYNAVRGFYTFGYESSFAKLSMNIRLKQAADLQSTNLYCCNLPLNMTKSELEAVFEPYRVESARIIADSQGHCTGSGFARFASREICEQVIADFAGKLIGPEAKPLQIRYADSAAQKQLKKLQQQLQQDEQLSMMSEAYHTGSDSATVYHAGSDTTIQAQSSATPRPFNQSIMSNATRASPQYQAPNGASLRRPSTPFDIEDGYDDGFDDGFTPMLCGQTGPVYSSRAEEDTSDLGGGPSLRPKFVGFDMVQRRDLTHYDIDARYFPNLRRGEISPSSSCSFGSNTLTSPDTNRSGGNNH
ncbi:MAG: RNA binding motif, single stranded interacting protein 3 [Piccolia ochrophora]|nr:MAG: RNA binding motif, single stranded interacting protein 3 [Piccolia ochrophora]